MKKLHLSHQSGFTLVELLIATAIFSTVLMLCAFAIVHVGRMYYKGSVINRTQDMSRKVMDDVARAAQFGATEGDPESGAGGGFRSWCLGDVRYTFHTNASQGTDLGQVAHVLWRDFNYEDTCSPQTAFTPGTGESLLANNMRIPTFDISSSADLFTIALVISYGRDADLFDPTSNFSICKGTSADGQFCASSNYNTSVMKRL